MTPPQNAGYMYVAYAAALIIYGAYTLSIWLRARALARRMARASDSRGSGATRV